MNKKMFKVLGSLVLAVGSLFTLTNTNKSVVNVEAGYAGRDADSYYAGISNSLTGDQLKTALHKLNDDMRKSKCGYEGMKTQAPNTDADPNGSGRIVSFYSRTLVGPKWDSAKTWNREHVWPDSHGGGKVDNDAHMVRPCSTSDNGSRGNKFYSTTQYDPAELGFPNYRGIASRIIFYCAIADTSLSIIDANTGGSSQMGKLSDMLKWNLEYLPSKDANADLELKVEQSRNEYIANTLQGNRNPFIDHPSYACKIWGNTNDATRAVCAGHMDDDDSGNTGTGGGTTVTAPTIEIYKRENGSNVKVTESKLSLNVGDEVTLLSYVNGEASKACSWEDTNPSASISVNYYNDNMGRTIIANAPGSTTLKIGKTYTDNGTTKTIYKELQIEVKTQGGGGGGTSTGDGELSLVTAISSLSNGDYVEIANAEKTQGVTGWNNQKDATLSGTDTDWVKYQVEVSGSSVYLKDSKTSEYITKPTDNWFKYGDKAPVNVTNDGTLMCNDRYLCINGSYNRFYSAVGSYTPLKLYKFNATTGGEGEDEKTVTKIEASGTYQTQYNDGDNFNPNGLVITATYSDGSTEDVTDKIRISGTQVVVGQTSVTVFYEYEGVTVSCLVSITVTGTIPTPPIDDDDDDDDGGGGTGGGNTGDDDDGGNTGGNTDDDDDGGNTGGDDSGDDIEPTPSLPTLGCVGNVFVPSLVISVLTLLATCLLMLRKKKNN